MGGKKCQSNREGFEERRMTSKKREVRKRRCKIQYAEKILPRKKMTRRYENRLERK